MTFPSKHFWIHRMGVVMHSKLIFCSQPNGARHNLRAVDIWRREKVWRTWNANDEEAGRHVTPPHHSASVSGKRFQDFCFLQPSFGLTWHDINKSCFLDFTRMKFSHGLLSFQQQKSFYIITSARSFDYRDLNKNRIMKKPVVVTSFYFGNQHVAKSEIQFSWSFSKFFILWERS